MISAIHERRSWRRLWMLLSPEGRRQVLYIADGDLWGIDDILEDVLAEERRAK